MAFVPRRLLGTFIAVVTLLPVIGALKSDGTAVRSKHAFDNINPWSFRSPKPKRKVNISSIKLTNPLKLLNDVSLQNVTHTLEGGIKTIKEKSGNALQTFKLKLSSLKKKSNSDKENDAKDTNKTKTHFQMPTLFPPKPTKAPGWPLGPCRSPQPGEKIVYFIQSEDAPYGYEEEDAMLYPDSAEKVKSLRNDTRLHKALYGNVSERVQVVISSPNRKTMETAILSVGDVVGNATWEFDPRVRGINRDGDMVMDLGKKMLIDLGHPEFVKPYADKFDNHVHGGHDRRWIKFLDDLRARPEERFILVTHAWQCEKTGISIQPGEVRILALRLDPPEDDMYGGNAWRQLSKPECWDLPKNGDDDGSYGSNITAIRRAQAAATAAAAINVSKL